MQTTPVMPDLPTAAYRLLSLVGRDLRAFLTTYPLWCRYPEASIYHFAQQAMTSLLLVRRPKGKVVVTVHDIIPHLLQNDSWFRLAVHGLRRADHLIAISQFTKRTLVDKLGIPPERISVVYHGIDHQHFRPLSPADSIRERYRLPHDRRYLMYVGSESPRKNLATLVHALAQVRHEVPEVELIKAGWSHDAQERQRLVSLAAEVGVLAAIHFLEDVPEDHLPQLYNLAELYVTPSLYEGFGLPLLEAMACGTPVVHADAGSLPEIAGNAGIAVSPCTAERLASAVLGLLRRKDEQVRLQGAGRARAAEFTWPRTAQAVSAVYRTVMNSDPDKTGAASRASRQRWEDDRRSKLAG